MGKIGGGLVREQKDNRGTSAGTQKALNWEVAGVDRWKPETDKAHRINIIPFRIASKKHPLVATGKKKVGEWVYCLELFVHTYIHETRDVVCLKKNYGKPCPLCEEANKKWDIFNNTKLEDDKKAAQAVSPTRRVFYNIQLASGEDKGKHLLWEFSSYRFEDELVAAATECEDGAEPIAFYELDAEEGKIVKFTLPKDWNKVCKNFSFLDRKKPLNPKLVKNAVALDELIDLMTAKEITEFYYGDDFVEDEDDEKDEDNYYDDDDDDFDNDDSDDDSDSSDDDDDFSDDDDSDDDADEADEEDNEDDDDEEERKPSKKKSKSSDKSSAALKCPKKHKFGADYGDYPECDDCKLEMKCYKASKSK